MSQRPRIRQQPIARLERSLFGKREEHDLLRLRRLEEENVERPQHQHSGLA